MTSAGMGPTHPMAEAPAPMESSHKLLEGLLAVQQELSNPPKSADNPFLNSKYAPLDVILNMIRPLLSKNGLVLMQDTGSDEQGVYVTTTITHISGRTFESQRLYMTPAKNTPQGIGSTITYARRYQLLSLFGIVGEDDDDGEGAERRKQSKPAPKPKPKAPAPAAPLPDKPKKVMKLKSAGEAVVDKKVGKAQIKGKHMGKPKGPKSAERASAPPPAEKVTPGSYDAWLGESDKIPGIKAVLDTLKKAKYTEDQIDDKLVLKTADNLIGSNRITPDDFKAIKKLLGHKVK